MAITFRCPDCGKSIRAGDNLAGRKVKCPECGSVVSAPDEDDGSAQMAERANRSTPESRREPRDSEMPSRRIDRDDDDFDRPRRRRDSSSGRSVNVLGVIALCLATVTMIFAVIPCVGFLSLPFSILSLLLAMVGLIVGFANGKWGLISPSIGLVLSGVAIAAPFVSTWALAYFVGSPARHIEEADKLYDQGKKKEAVALYKEHVGTNTVSIDKKNVAYQRIVDFEVEQGDLEEAKKWIEKAENDRDPLFGLEVVHPGYKTEKAQSLQKEVLAKLGRGSKRHSREPSGVPRQHIDWSEVVVFLVKEAEGDPPAGNDPTSRAKALLTWPQQSPDPRFVTAAVGERLWADKGFTITDLSPELDGAVVQVRGVGKSRKWLDGATMKARKDCAMYALVRINDGVSVKVDEQKLDELAAAGWQLTDLHVSSSDEGQPWEWKVLMKEFDEGETIGDLP